MFVPHTTGGISGIILKIMKGMYEPIPAGYSDEIKTLVASMLQVKPRRRCVLMFAYARCGVCVLVFVG